jgi:hypothetical protein
MDEINNPTFQHSIKLGYFILDITWAGEYAIGTVQFDVEYICKVVIFNTQ